MLSVWTWLTTLHSQKNVIQTKKKLKILEIAHKKISLALSYLIDISTITSSISEEWSSMTTHSSEIRGLCLMKWSREILQILPYSWKLKPTKFFPVFHFMLL